MQCRACRVLNDGSRFRLRATAILPVSPYPMLVRAFPLTSSSRCSSRFSRRSRKAWAWACRLREPLSKPTVGSYRRRTKPVAAQRFVSDYHLRGSRNECPDSIGDQEADFCHVFANERTCLFGHLDHRFDPNLTP